MSKISNKELIARYNGLLQGKKDDTEIPDFEVLDDKLKDVKLSYVAGVGNSKLTGIEYDSVFANLYPLVAYWLNLQKNKSESISELEKTKKASEVKTEIVNKVVDDSKSDNDGYTAKKRKTTPLFLIVMTIMAIIAFTLYFLTTLEGMEWARWLAGILGLIDPFLGIYCWWRESKDDAERIIELKKINDKNINEIKKTFTDLMNEVNGGYEKVKNIAIYNNTFNQDVYIEL